MGGLAMTVPGCALVSDGVGTAALNSSSPGIAIRSGRRIPSSGGAGRFGSVAATSGSGCVFFGASWTMVARFGGTQENNASAGKSRMRIARRVFTISKSGSAAHYALCHAPRKVEGG